MPCELLAVDEVREWDALPAGGEEGLRDDILGLSAMTRHMEQSGGLLWHGT